MANADTSRIINHDDAVGILEKLDAIADKIHKSSTSILKPTLSISTLYNDTEGFEETSIIPYLTNYDPQSMQVISGTVSAFQAGEYTFVIGLISRDDTWIDGTTENLSFTWTLKWAEETSWANATDAKICELVAASDAGEIDLHDDYGWSVGDTRLVQLNAVDKVNGKNVAHRAQKVRLVLASMENSHADCYQLTNPTSGGRTKSKFVVTTMNAIVEPIGNYEKVAWPNTIIYSECQAFFNSMLPSTLRPIFKQFRVPYTAQPLYHGGNYDISKIAYSDDFCTVPALGEILYNSQYSGSFIGDYWWMARGNSNANPWMYSDLSSDDDDLRRGVFMVDFKPGTSGEKHMYAGEPDYYQENGFIGLSAASLHSYNSYPSSGSPTYNRLLVARTNTNYTYGCYVAPFSSTSGKTGYGGYLTFAMDQGTGNTDNASKYFMPVMVI